MSHDVERLVTLARWDWPLEHITAHIETIMSGSIEELVAVAPPRPSDFRNLRVLPWVRCCMTNFARGTFEVEMTPGKAELDGSIGRFDFSKTFRGDFAGVGVGLMLSGGDPPSGSAGYVAMETVQGRLEGREGGFALQQFGTLRDGSQTMQYKVVPGSGSGDLKGMTGNLHLRVDGDGTHHYDLEYQV